jgi:beta-N-acetylhexosaminidase
MNRIGNLGINFTRTIISISFIMGLFATKRTPVEGFDVTGLSSNVALFNVVASELTTEEKIGQLFLVSFQGNQYGIDSRIHDLIANRHIGGILLESQNDNFTGPENILQTTYEMTSGLQNVAWESSRSEGSQNIYLPLFIAVSQNGDRAPLDQIISGMTPLPNQLAIGGTWNPDLAYQTGNVLGAELSSLGINMFLGPSLDVLDNIPLSSGEDLGAQVFGGDPYWVGEMGKAYIRGIHEGGQNRIAVISKNFPGRGGADRPSDEEVSTVRKSLEQLKQIELAPFLVVTGGTGSPSEITDGLLVSHIRYQGFQGNIRATTKPVSFDAAALQSILALDPIAGWRSNGGVVISDRLGSQSVKRFFDPTNSGFDARQIARNAFLAGNDLLILDQNFVATGDVDAFVTINRTLDFFIQKYDEDPAFAQRVDESVSRVISLKEKMYPKTKIENIVPPLEGLTNIGLSQKVSFQTARENASLISPNPEELKNIMPSPPEIGDRILFFTDTLSARQCSQCPDEIQMGVDTFQNAVLRLYGPHASGQVMQSYLESYSFSRLMTYLNDPAGDPELEASLKSADWLIFSILNLREDKPESSALLMLINNHQELIRNKKTIVFAFNAPYYLDATDISKLTAYYALYSKVGPFVDIAARILFQEISPNGASAVSIPGVGYEIIVATSPDPNQIIGLSVDTTIQVGSIPEGDTTPVPPVFKIGDTLPVTTGIIVDNNGNQVPDGTIARFLISTGGDVATNQQIETVTQNGIAKASYQITQPGQIEIRVISEPAMISQVLQLEVKEGEASQVTAIAPTAQISPTPFMSPTDDNPASSTSSSATRSEKLNFLDWLISILIIGLCSFGVYQIGRRNYSSRWGIRWATCSVIGGLLFYSTAVILRKASLSNTGTQEIIILGLTSVCGSVVGWAIGYIWMMLPRWMNKSD